MVLIGSSWAVCMLITDQQERAVTLQLTGIHEPTHMSTMESQFYAALMNLEWIFSAQVFYVQIFSQIY